ncbi:uncharacterized protein LOC128277045, partial [Anopheles cruzii]|uniref:uncharacterized protein LOC128277044 n=1 Tax=Anopheles cruzii TaxID=68878 RepID=UPI0022EC7551
VDARGYFERVGKRVVDILETRYITGNSLSIGDYVAPINVSDKGIRIDGQVSFHSAFVAKIGAIDLDMQRFTETLLDTEVSVSASLKWHEIAVVLDFEANLVDYTGSLQFMSIDNSNNIVTAGYPNNKHVQMISREVITNYDYRDLMIASFRNWNFLNILALAISDIPFSEVCYNC